MKMETTTREKVKAFEEAAKPLIKFLNEFGNPYMTAIVTTTRGELFTGKMSFNNDEFVKD